MEISVYSQATGFLVAILAGAVLGVFYDVVRLIRLMLPKNKILFFIEDMLFFLVSAVACFLFVFAINAGEVRGYLIFGILNGFVLYYFTVGQLVHKISGAAASLIKRFFRTAGRIIATAFKWIFAWLRKLARVLKKLAGKIWPKRQTKKKNKKETKKKGKKDAKKRKNRKKSKKHIKKIKK